MNIEKKTLWKISDIDEILKRRITEDYVDDSCRALEEKLKREVKVFSKFFQNY